MLARAAAQRKADGERNHKSDRERHQDHAGRHIRQHGKMKADEGRADAGEKRDASTPRIVRGARRASCASAPASRPMMMTARML